MLYPVVFRPGAGLTGLSLILAALALVGPAGARGATPYDMINTEAASSPVTLTPLRDNVRLMQGSGGNIAVLSGPDGLFLSDAGIALSKAKILAALPKGKIKYAVNTHWHWDHSDGDGWMRATGTNVIAHANTVKHLKQTIRVDEWEHTFTPVAKSALPNIAITAPRTFKLDGEAVLVRPYMPSHTDGDLSVYFTRADVLTTGDIYWNGLYPFIDYKAGGSIDGTIAAATASIGYTKPSSLIVPGHGPAAHQADLIAYRDMLVDIRGKVAALKTAGKSLADIIAADPTAAYDAKWGHGLISPALFTTLVYKGL